MFPGKFNINMASRAQEKFLYSLRHTLLDLARRLQQDTVGEDVADYVLFGTEHRKSLPIGTNFSPFGSTY